MRSAKPSTAVEIEPAIFKRAAGKLASFGRPATFDPTESFEHTGDDRLAAMKLQLSDILAGLAARRREPQRQRFVDNFTPRRIAHTRQHRLARLRQAPDQFFKGDTRARPGHAYHGNRRRRPAGGEGEDGGTIRHDALLRPMCAPALRSGRATCYGASMSTPTMSTSSHASASHENRLAQETSPYLLQHQHNPVDWWAWGPDALAEAKRTGRPILLSVGYAACHWCHVMAHESFEDDATARVMNELFVNIKVDREERPDIDQIYMAALHHLGEHGGWPLTMFLTPAGEPIWGGTYFPKTSRYGKPAFVDVLREIARLFREEPQKIETNRAALMEQLAATARKPGTVTIGATELDNAARQLGGIIDPVQRGHPRRAEISASRTVRIALAWGLAQRREALFAAVDITLDHVCEGGIYDHLGGGFSRYSVDEQWLVPHFEKMLYDNAQLLELLAIAHRRSGKPLYRQRAHETVDVAHARNDDAGGRILSLARCRLRRRGGQILCLVTRRGDA